MDSFQQASSNKKIRSELGKFLYQGDLLQLILAVYLGTAVEKFFNSFVSGIVLPIIMIFMPRAKDLPLQDIQISILGQDLSIGEVISNSINVIIGFMISYIFVKYFIQRYLK